MTAMLQPEILFEDQDLLAIAKPYGVVVNRAETVHEQTVQDWMDERLKNEAEHWPEWQSLLPADFSPEYGSPEEIFAQRMGIVHRLDRDTSGVLLLAKNPGSLVNLLAQFRTRQVQKRYQCLAHGKFTDVSGIVNAPLGRLPGNRKLFGVVADGREAVTEYRVERYFAALKSTDPALLLRPAEIKQAERIYQGFSLVSCWPKTGRTHQIRVHMKHLQHPLVGDAQYGGKKRAKLDQLWCPRQFLHALELTVTHPRDGQRLTLQAPLSPDLQAVLGRVE